jgi:hypothetical protein
VVNTLRTAPTSRSRSFAAAIAISTAALFLSIAPVTAQVFVSEAFGGAGDGKGGYVANSGDYDLHIETPIPYNTHIVKTNTFTGAGGNVSFSFNAASNYRGFWSSGTYAAGSVTNAYFPTGQPIPSTNPPFGYYVLGGIGSWTKHRFVSPESLTGPYAVMTWHVDGVTDSNFGTANSRLDFGVGQGATSYFDIYNPSVTPLMTKYGPGTYTYNTAVAMNTPLDFFFWSSAYWEVSMNQLASLGSGHMDMFGEAQFNHTFNLDTIELFNADGSPVNEWSLLDESTGQVVFNQSGRIAAVPEPGAYAGMIGVGVTSLGFLLRRRKL